MRIYERLNAAAERLRAPRPLAGHVGVMEQPQRADVRMADNLEAIADAFLARDAEMDELKQTLKWAAGGFIAALLYVAML
jgi:hypothetical protein